MRKTIDRRDFLGSIGASTGITALPGLLARATGKPLTHSKGKPAMIRIAMLSKWHVHAKHYAQQLKKTENVAITAVWDEDAARGEEWAKELEAPFEKDLAAVLKRRDVDAVVVDVATNRHAEVMVAAAHAKKHIFTEKVMALTLDECKQLSDAVQAAGVKFGISFPYRTRPECLYAYQAVQDGLLGQVTSIRVRLAHNGASAGWMVPHFYDPVECGGGAMMDLGAHPMYLCRWLGGQPKRIVSSFSHVTGHEIEDNAVSVIEFENKAIGVAETSLVSTNSPFSLELSGTEGSLLAGGVSEQNVSIRSNKLPTKEWTTPTDLPAALPHPLVLWIDGILKNTPIPFGLEEGTQLTELMQYAYVAHRERRQVDIPPRTA